MIINKIKMNIEDARKLEDLKANEQRQRDLNDFFAMMLDVDIEPEEEVMDNE